MVDNEADKRNKVGAMIAKLMSKHGGNNALIDIQGMLNTFHRVYGQTCETNPTHMDVRTAKLRLALVQEEFEEFGVHISQYIDLLSHHRLSSELSSVGDDLFVDIVDDCLDIIFVAVGTLVSMGVDFPRTFTEVFLSNMSKLDSEGNPLYREDGKVLKGENYFKPDFSACIRKINRRE